MSIQILDLIKETIYMAHRYLIKLMQQYSKATGYPETVIYDQAYLQWISDYKKQLQQLKAYYKSVGLDVNNPRVYETDKGLGDSIAYDINHQITQYEDPYWYLTVINNKPTLIDDKRKMYDISTSNLIYTFNPYDRSCLDIYARLAKIGQPIAISMIGKNYEMDKEEKIQFLKELKQRVLLNCKEDYVEDKDNYIYTVHSDKRTPTFGSARMR